jgi:hypothetical protein
MVRVIKKWIDIDDWDIALHLQSEGWEIVTIETSSVLLIREI